MKKLILLLSVIILGLSVNAEGVTLTGEARFDWVDMTQIQRDTNIEHYRNILFGDESECGAAQRCRVFEAPAG